MISLVIPCFNEGEGLRLTHRALDEAAATWDTPVEIIFIDDGSSDATWNVIESLVASDPRVRGLRLSRNFGHQAAMGAGLEHATGDAVVVLDADLQDPPSLVPEMLAQWRAGYEIVFAQRSRRHGETWFKLATADLFYRLLDGITSVTIPRNTGDFVLLDARVVRQLLTFREHGLFWRGLRAWTGFRQTSVMFDRPARAFGETKYTLRKMVRLATTALVSFSELPARLPLYAGVATWALTLLVALGTTGYWAFAPAGTPWPLSWTTLGLFFLGGVQLICLGVLGEYLYRIFDEVRDRPRWIVADRLDASQAAQSAGSTLRNRAA